MAPRTACGSWPRRGAAAPDPAGMLGLLPEPGALLVSMPFLGAGALAGPEADGPLGVLAPLSWSPPVGACHRGRSQTGSRGSSGPATAAWACGYMASVSASLRADSWAWPPQWMRARSGGRGAGRHGRWRDQRHGPRHGAADGQAGQRRRCRTKRSAQLIRPEPCGACSASGNVHELHQQHAPCQDAPCAPARRWPAPAPSRRSCSPRCLFQRPAAGGAGCCCARSTGLHRWGRFPLPRPDPPTAARQPAATASRSPVGPVPLRQWPHRRAPAGCPGPHGCRK